MTHSLLIRQLRKHLGLPSEQARGLDSLSSAELAETLRTAPPEALAALLSSVKATYHEADQSRRRLNHALRLSSDELFEANLILARHASELETQLGLLNAAMDATPDGVLVVDRAGKVLLANEKFASMWQIPRESIIVDDDAALVGQVVERLKDPAAFQRRLAELYAEPESESFEELEFLDGSVFERFTRPVRVRGQSVARIWLFRDVSTQRLVERERERLTDHLRQAQRMEAVGKLAGGIAHDFNNLLMAIMGYSESLERQLHSGDPLREDVSGILEAADRAANLTRQLLAFSRRQVLQPKIVDLNRIVTDMGAMLRRLIGEDVELVLAQGSELGHVMADPGQLEQVLLNLAVNARDAMPRGGKLTIQTANVEIAPPTPEKPEYGSGPHVMLAVSDTGCGMSDEVQQHAFEPFFTTKALGKGTGLGLSTVFGIVRQSGGWICLTSKPGEGSVFQVFFPEVRHDPEQEMEASTDQPQLGNETVLVVEDETMVRELVTRSLQSEGYRVASASSGAEALHIAENHAGPIDMLLTDVVLPGMSGAELATKFSILRPRAKVIFMSGYADESEFRHPDFDVAASFLQKPFSASTMTRKVRKALEVPTPRG